MLNNHFDNVFLQLKLHTKKNSASSAEFFKIGMISTVIDDSKNIIQNRYTFQPYNNVVIFD
ncbi:hypothetical protein [Staphylococcus caeli]|uniref:Uncharacterized protein n=1 Tax=Staphylococcus caeli TaxID=2201815 RepID=A0A1D4IXY8_9STAP|nr:hypothetical protein [Staphylococcus caeli]SCS36367.1 Uncharacterised protein [Staphylococcus caeli]SCS54363.1 Uncharacterised protein [Staphylococcus caeli]